MSKSARDLAHNVKSAASLPPASRTTNADGVYVDTRDFGAVMLVGIRSADNAEFVILESDNGTTGAPAAAADFELVIDAAGTQTIHYKGTRRFVAARVVHGSPTASAVVAGAVILLGLPRISPVTN